MEIIYLFIGLVLGVSVTAVIYSLKIKGGYFPRRQFDEQNQTLNQVTSQLHITEERFSQLQQKLSEINSTFQLQKEQYTLLQRDYNFAQQQLSHEQAANKAYIEQKQEQQRTVNALNLRIEALQNQQQQTSNQKSELEARNTMLLEKQLSQKAEMEELHQKAKLEFEKMATEILEDRTRKFTEVNKINLDAIIKPLGENIEGFKRTIQQTHIQETKDRASLETKVKELIFQTHKISDEANNLASALKGQTKTQGNWGEMILESILEHSGLVKNREYFLQQTIKDASGKMLRPDVLIKLPDNRTIIIDSKVSLRAYDRYVAATTPEEKQVHLKHHLLAVNNHIQELHQKNYDQIETSLDFTMLFVPIEPAYLLSMQQDPELWANAYNKRILLISPTNLIACLKLMDDLWKREKQSQHALEIVKKGEQIYEKLVGFVLSIEAVGENLQRTQRYYEKAVNQLKDGKGNLIDQAIKLKAMGLKSSKQFPMGMLPSIDEQEVGQTEQPDGDPPAIDPNTLSSGNAEEPIDIQEN